MTEARARSLAAIGLLGLVLAVTAYAQPRNFGPISLDTVVVGVPLAILFCIPYVRRKGLGSVPRYLMGPIALFFLVWGLLAVIANGGDFSSWLTMARYASYFLLAIVVSVVAQDRAIRRLLLWTMTVTAALTAGLAYAQYAFPQFTPGMNGISPEITTRVVGTFYNSNFYAEYLLLILGVVLGLLFTEKLAGKIIAGALGLVILGAFLLTYTRGSWVGLAVGLLVFIIVVDIRYLLLAAVLAVGALFVPGVSARLQQSTANAGSAEFRLGIWKIAGQAMASKPAFGYGPGDFLTAYRDVVITHPDLYQGYLGFGAHNSYFELAAEIGILGGLAFMAVTIIYAVQGVFIATRANVDRETKYLALGISAGLIGFVANTFTSNTFQHPQSGLFFWILSGIVAALGAGLWSEETRPQAEVEVREDSAVGGSAAGRGILALRRWASSCWRASTTFERANAPGRAHDGWFESSAVMRALFDGKHEEKHTGE